MKYLLSCSFLLLLKSAYCQDPHFQAATIYFPRAGANIPDAALNFNYYVTNNPIDHLNANFNEVPNTKGNRYIFDNWAKGSVTTSTGAVISNDSIYFNFDKIKNSLLLLRKDSVVLELFSNQISKFSLDENNNNLFFEKVNTISPDLFLQVLIKKENGFSLYKSIKTTFKKADYTTDGLMESGHNYDEYIDNYVYYITTHGENDFKTIELKMKSLKSVFNENAKFKEFTKQQPGKIDETYIINLINFIN